MLHRDNLAFTISTENFVRLSNICRWKIVLCVQVVTLYTHMFTNINYTFCPHNVFMCFCFGPKNKQQVFAYTAINVWYLQQIPRDYRYVNRNIYVSQCSIISKVAVPWLRQLEFDVRLRKPAFDWRSFHQGIVVYNVALKLVFFWYSGSILAMAQTKSRQPLTAKD